MQKNLLAMVNTTCTAADLPAGSSICSAKPDLLTQLLTLKGAQSGDTAMLQVTATAQHNTESYRTGFEAEGVL